MKRNDLKVSGEKLKYYRLTVRKLTQGQLAVKSGVEQSNISRMEKERYSNCKLATVSAVAHALRIPIWRLLEGEQGAIEVDPIMDALGRDVLMLSVEGRAELERYMRYLLWRETQMIQTTNHLL